MEKFCIPLYNDVNIWLKKNCTEYLKVWEGIFLSDAFNNNSTKIQQDKNKQ